MAATAFVVACSGPGASVVAMGWQAGPSLATPAGTVGEVRALVAPAGARGWVAVGAGHIGANDEEPLWWTSPDGRSWAAGSVQAVTADGPRSGFLGIAAAPGGVAALGAAFSPIHGNARPLVWRADASGALVEVPITRELFGGPRTIGVAAIAGGPGGFTVVGNYLVGGTWLGGPSVAAPTAWTSATGAVWARLDGSDAPPTTPSEIAIVRGVVEGGGRLVMFGDSTPLSVGPGRPALWCSTGAAWARVAPSATGALSSRTTVLRAGAARSGGFVIAGVESDPSGARADPVAFTSTDCAHWRRQPLGTAVGTVTVFDAAAAGDRALVVWADGMGMHLTELGAGGIRPLAPPALAGPVTGAHAAATADQIVLVVDTAAGASPLTARW